MPSQVYKWKRFWCPRSGSINLADGGYLPDPGLDWGRACHSGLVSFEAIADLPCLVLLGEAGMGKTTAIETAHKEVYNRTKDSEDVCLRFKLGDYGSDTELCSAIFRNDAFQAWHQGSNKLHLFLDSLDEGFLSIKILVRILKREIENLPCDRLYFRITCRTAEWAFSLEEKLEEKWGKDNVSVYEIAPLRRSDVIEAASKNNINSDEFLQEILNRNAIPLAIKPVTLNFLLDIYAEKRQFPASQEELYEKGCLQLCEEVNPDRCEAGFKGQLSAKKRRVLAGRIAAVMLFSNRVAVWTSPEYGKIPDSDISLQDLCIGKEKADEQDFDVDEGCIREVFAISGLFSAQGFNHRTGFAHRTYAEFLAAWYLKQRQLKLPQILDLIVHSDDPDNRIVPQLHETVAWLSSMVPEVFQKVMETDPDVLLRSDLATIDESIKASLVESLLKLHHQDKLAYQYRFRGYEHLKHSRLPAQLQSYISDSARSIQSRYIAIDIAQDCNVQAVQSDLADVALDIDQPYWIRTRAASAVISVGDEQTKRRLKRLAFSSKDDLEDELKGYALQAVYPIHMTTEEVLNCLTQPKASYVGGCYQDFVAKELGLRLPLTDLLVALEWLLKDPIRDPAYPFRELSDALILKAWNHLEYPEVLSKFAQIALLRLSQHGEMIGDSHGTSFKQLLEENDFKRRQLLEAVISIIPNSEKEPLWLAGYTEYSPLTPLKQDFLWLIEKLQTSDSDQIQRTYAKLIRWKLDWHSADQLSSLLTVSQNNPILRAEFSLELEPILLNSHKADQARLEYIKLQEMLTPKNQRKLLDPPPKIRVLECLSQFEAGSVDAWCHLCREMTLTPASTQYNESFEADITILPGWQEADEKTKFRIIAAAKQYVYQGKPETEAWLGTNSFRYSALAGYRSLRILSEKDPDFISIIPPDIWKKWAAVILDYPNAREDKDKKIRQRLIKEAYKNAPSEFVRALIILVDHENAEHGSVHINRELKDFWDEHLAAVLVDKVQDERLSAKSLGNLLTDLLVNQVDEAKVFAESLIPLSLPTDGEARAKAIIAAKMLMLYAEDAGWSVVWSAIQQDPKFGREVIESVSYHAAYQGNVEQKLKEDCIADLYIFLSNQYPDVEEKQEEGSQPKELKGVEAYISTREDDVRTWRDYIPQRLQERGTKEACAALRKIIYELPELKDSLQWRLLEAEALTRRQTWQPLSPEEVLKIVSSQPENQSANIQAGVLIMQGSNNPNLNFGGSVGAVNVNSTVHGDQIGTQHNYASEQNLVEAFDEIQQIFNRLTQNYPTSTESEQQIVVAEAVKEVKQNPTLMKRVKVGGQAFIFEALQKASDQWWVSPFVKAIEAGIKGE